MFAKLVVIFIATVLMSPPNALASPGCLTELLLAKPTFISLAGLELPQPESTIFSDQDMLKTSIGSWRQQLAADSRFVSFGRDYITGPPQILHPEYLIGEIVSVISVDHNKHRADFAMGRVVEFVDVELAQFGINRGLVRIQPREESIETVLVPVKFFSLLDLRVMRHQQSRVAPLALPPDQNTLYLSIAEQDFSDRQYDWRRLLHRWVSGNLHLHLASRLLENKDLLASWLPLEAFEPSGKTHLEALDRLVFEILPPTEVPVRTILNESRHQEVAHVYPDFHFVTDYESFLQGKELTVAVAQRSELFLGSFLITFSRFEKHGDQPFLVGVEKITGQELKLRVIQDDFRIFVHTP